MQTIALYGLHVECNDVQHNEYMHLKAVLENAFKEIKRASIVNDFKYKCIHYVRLNNDYKLSFCLRGRDLQIGVVTPDNKQLLNNCDFNVLKGLTEREMNALTVRAVNMISQPNRYFIPMQNLENMWERAIIDRERESLKDVELLSLPLDKGIETAKKMAILDAREQRFLHKDKQNNINKSNELEL